MSRTLSERLQLIREGVLLEADDDKYDLPKDGDPASAPSAESATSDDVADPTDGPATSDSATDPATPDDSTNGDGGDGSNYDMNSDGNDPAATGTDADQSGAEPVGDTPKPGEIIPLDDTSRKLLAYKNFRKYRELRDSMMAMLSELTDTSTVSEDSKKIITICITHTSALVEKLNDYIVYRYEGNSYEVNYKNFMSFILEKRLIENILEEMNQNKE